MTGTDRKPIQWLSWRLFLPVFTALLVGGMVLAYIFAVSAGNTTGGDYAAQARAQLGGLLFSSLAAALIIGAFIAVNLVFNRVERVRAVVDALAAGEAGARTGMTGRDELGALGAALDRYADYVQERQDGLRETLRRQRREVAHLTSVLESLPDGVIVQDQDGRVVLMNDRARELMGSHEAVRSTSVQAVTAAVTDILGPSLAPGLYALGDPQRVEVDGRMLSAQAATVMSLSNQRVGTIIVLRDITRDVRREQVRDVLLTRLSRDVQTPLADSAQTVAGENGAMRSFAREMTRHAAALQKFIVEMRELTSDVDARDLGRGNRPIPLDTLIWAVANEWRQVAQATNINTQVMIEQPGLYILGDERRLRWALGNLVDNAIKYTAPGGTFTLEIRGESSGMAHLRVRDNGVGIAPDELSHVFTRFYRGNPTTESGRVLRVPGTGQGLTVARQIIEAHGGTISIKSTRFVGTAVNIALPLTAPVSLQLPTGAHVDLEGETVRLDREDSA
jgi:two-component system sensor histidine kinase VicK